MMQCYLYTLDPDTKVVSNDILDSLTVTAFGTDFVIINNQNAFSRRSFGPLADIVFGFHETLPTIFMKQYRGGY